MGLELPSISTYKRIFEEVRLFIGRVYEKHQSHFIKEITEAYQNEGECGWDMAVDGAYDSKGRSAELCKVLAVDLRTKRIHSEVVNLPKQAGSGRMEKEGFHRMPRWVQSRDLFIRSIATDRSPMYGTEINSYNMQFGKQIEWRLVPDMWTFIFGR
ncbi:unnamed protein product [Cylicocyclus nassatus]|uniref:Transposase n=1 Tax=Cylicocyclus nassatus TaxID=53992 RepID=A0AA36H8X9_CYLNA|nr:unnamed protein product [Cylicocyclus nassatus]